MKPRTLICAASYLNISCIVLGLGIAAGSALVAIGNLIEGAACCWASERQP